MKALLAGLMLFLAATAFAQHQGEVYLKITNDTGTIFCGRDDVKLDFTDSTYTLNTNNGSLYLTIKAAGNYIDKCVDKFTGEAYDVVMVERGPGEKGIIFDPENTKKFRYFIANVQLCDESLKLGER
jgi:hypothetical protein